MTDNYIILIGSISSLLVFFLWNLLTDFSKHCRTKTKRFCSYRHRFRNELVLLKINNFELMNLNKTKRYVLCFAFPIANTAFSEETFPFDGLFTLPTLISTGLYDIRLRFHTVFIFRLSLTFIVTFSSQSRNGNQSRPV